MPSACSGDDAYRRSSSSKVPLGSSMSAHSSPGQSPSIRRGVLARVSTPRASARRLAGSMVTTQARRPRRAASRAKAADTVVLPTPPDPQHTTMARSATISDSPTVALGDRRHRRHGGAAGRRARRRLRVGRAHRDGVAGAAGAASSGSVRGSGARAPSSGSRRTAAASWSASVSSSSGPMPALKRNGAWSCGRGSSAARRARCSSWRRKRRARNAAAAAQRARPGPRSGSPRPRRRPPRDRARGRARRARQALTMTGPERDADPVLERRRRPRRPR